MITYKTPKEIQILREGGRITAYILRTLRQAVFPGITTLKLNQLAEELIFKYKGKPSFLGHQNYPYSLCVSLNEEIVHGLPKKTKLKEGDILSLDLGVCYKGYHTDAAVTFAIGRLKNKVVADLIKTTLKALKRGISQVKAGNHIGHISWVIQKTIEKRGFFVVKSLSGHGIGKNVHEDPAIPNFIQKETIFSSPRLKKGMVLAIEPMVLLKENELFIKKDGWTVTAKKGNYTAHFEHTVAVTEKGCEILTQI